MVSAIGSAKRFLVSLLLRPARLYDVALSITRTSSDVDVRHAYHKLCRKCHPDRGGDKEHQQSLNNAHCAWEDAKRDAKERVYWSWVRKQMRLKDLADLRAGRPPA